MVVQLAPQPALPTAPSAAPPPVVASAPRADLAREVALLDAARQALVEGNAEAAEKSYAKIVDKYPGSPQAAEAKAALERLKAGTGK